MHGKYNTADFVLSAIAMIGWLGVAGGIWAAFKLLGMHNAIGALAISGAVIAVSLVLIAITQLARAQIDTAITNAEILALMQRQADRRP